MLKYIVALYNYHETADLTIFTLFIAEETEFICNEDVPKLKIPK